MNRRSFLTGLLANGAAVKAPAAAAENLQDLSRAVGNMAPGRIHYAFWRLYEDELSDYLFEHCEFLDTPFVRLAGGNLTPANPVDPIDGPAPFCA